VGVSGASSLAEGVGLGTFDLSSESGSPLRLLA
jgi:hypothetical protein